MTAQRYQFQRQAYQNATFSSVAEAYWPDPPSPAGVNFFLSPLQGVDSSIQYWQDRKEISKFKNFDANILYI